MMLKMQPSTIEARQQSDAEKAVDAAAQLVDDLSAHIADEDGRVHYAPKKADAETCFRSDLISQGRLMTREGDDKPLTVSHVAIQGVSFRTTKAFRPGTTMFLQTDASRAALVSKVRIVSCRLRSDGQFDIKAEFF